MHLNEVNLTVLKEWFNIVQFFEQIYSKYIPIPCVG